MQKLTILVDMDDTLEGLLDAWVEYLNSHHGTNVKPEEVTDWAVWKFFPSIPEKEVYAPLYEDTFWDNVKPLEGAVSYLSKLNDDGHRIYIVTASNYQTLRAKMEKVLFKYFPFISWQNVIITCNKQLIKGDVLIDDGPHNLVGGDYFKIMMDSPHNRKFDAEANGILRVQDWEDIYRAVSMLVVLKNEA